MEHEQIITSVGRLDGDSKQDDAFLCWLTVTHTRCTVSTSSVGQEPRQTGLFCLQLQNANSVLITIPAAGKIVFHILFFSFASMVFQIKMDHPAYSREQIGSATESYLHFKWESNASQIPPLCLRMNITSVFAHSFAFSRRLCFNVILNLPHYSLFFFLKNSVAFLSDEIKCVSAIQKTRISAGIELS